MIGKDDITVCIVKQAEKMEIITVKKGMTIAECLKKAKIDFDESKSPEELDLRLWIGKKQVKAKFTTKVMKNNSYISLALKIKGGK